MRGYPVVLVKRITQHSYFSSLTINAEAKGLKKDRGFISMGDEALFSQET